MTDLPLFASREAHRRIEPKVDALQALVLVTLRRIGPCTHHDLIAALPAYSPSTVRTRVKELVGKGLAAEAGLRRLPNGFPATLWAAR